MKARTKLIIVIGAVLVGGPSLYVWNYDLATQRREAAALARLKALGYATTVEEFRETEPTSNVCSALLTTARTSKSRKIVQGEPGQLRDFLFTPGGDFLADFPAVQPGQSLWLAPDLPHPDRIEIFRYLKSAHQSYVRVAEERIFTNPSWAKDALTQGKSLEMLLRSEGSVLAVVMADGMANGRARVILKKAMMERTLEERRAWTSLIEPFPSLDAREFVATTLRSLDSSWRDLQIEADEIGPFTKADALLMRFRPVSRRVKVVALESLAIQAHYSTDGAITTADEFGVYRRYEALAKSETFLERHCVRFCPVNLLGVTQEERLARSLEYPVVAAASLELLGGPSVNPAPGIKITRSHGKTEVFREGALVRHVLTSNSYQTEIAKP